MKCRGKCERTPPYLIQLYINPPTRPRSDRENAQMASLRRLNKLDPMGKSSKSVVKCKKHPKHRQSPGVCSRCLNEKLSQLSSSSGSRRTSSPSGSGSCSSSPSSLSSYYSSSSASSCSSPVHLTNMEGKIISSLSFLLNSKNGLTKSRSLVFFPRVNRPRGDDDDDMRNYKKKGGFWSKILRATSKRQTEETLMHSRTMREIVMTTDE
ncbi:uncharacterized protein LOC121244056 [Juglans microcarpa x Juglans regia]|uniref:uncharacterized protein LOC121244056 n=1 Tax=Juglans microcarpa x Juglans regia TaxID=2249226 RepID=UPI001B7DE8BF|nr:uncharacterized protein LOC121244056 [Juglans microcarpa x Juglans regia]